MIINGKRERGGKEEGKLLGWGDELTASGSTRRHNKKRKQVGVHGITEIRSLHDL
jgi:hypothetical protein